jgi:HlyD family secretion protein
MGRLSYIDCVGASVSSQFGLAGRDVLWHDRWSRTERVLSVNRLTRRLLFLVLAVGAIVALRATVFRPDPVPVTVFAAQRGRVEDTVVNSRAGTVDSRHRAELSPGIPGLVVATPVKKGEVVTKGQVLVRLDDAEARAQRDLAARSLEAVRAAEREAGLSAEQARRDHERAKGLAELKLIATQALEEAETRAEASAAAHSAARERVRQAEAALEVARATLDKTTITAPFDGVVLDLRTEVGEWISPSPTGVALPPIVDLIDLRELYVSAPLDEADVAKVRVGLPVRITHDAFRDRAFSGRLSYVSSYVETRQEQNRTLTVEATYDDATLPANLVPGLSADIEVILDARDDVLRIPSYALLEGGRVLVLEGDELAEKPVVAGLRNWEFTEITEGLHEGDRVVTSLDRPEVKKGARATLNHTSP